MTRLPGGGHIARNAPVDFTFDGKTHQIFTAPDTLRKAIAAEKRAAAAARRRRAAAARSR